MTLRHISNMKAPIGEIIDAAGEDGLLIDRHGLPAFAVIPLDDELLDYLLERSPRLIEDCKRVRQAMRQGEFHSHDDVRKLLKE